MATERADPEDGGNCLLYHWVDIAENSPQCFCMTDLQDLGLVSGRVPPLPSLSLQAVIGCLRITCFFGTYPFGMTPFACESQVKQNKSTYYHTNLPHSQSDMYVLKAGKLPRVRRGEAIEFSLDCIYYEALELTVSLV
jgi:hypothetical protein